MNTIKEGDLTKVLHVGKCLMCGAEFECSSYETLRPGGELHTPGDVVLARCPNRICQSKVEVKLKYPPVVEPSKAPLFVLDDILQQALAFLVMRLASLIPEANAKTPVQPST